jgi:hypothetical protein
MDWMKGACALLIVSLAGLAGIDATGIKAAGTPASGNSAAGINAAGHSKIKDPPPDLAPADTLFQEGRFDEAKKIYADAALKDKKDFRAAFQLGHIALLSNKLGDAEMWLTRALDLKHHDVDTRILLAETLYRKNDFFHAAREIAGLGPGDAAKLANYATLNAAKLDSFREEDPYKFDKGAGESTRLPFVARDPLPVVKVRVNGGPDVTFFIDTGGSELLLDAEFARELKLKSFGDVQGTFSGGQHAPVGNSRIESLTLGSWTIRNVPVGTLPIRSMSASFGVKQLNGCIGTNVLYQFLSTIDYRAGELILRKKSSANLKRFEADNDGKAYVIPMWMAGDHFMITWAEVDRMPPALMFVDSGLAGAGVKLAESTIQKAGIHLDESKATEGQGGGGALKIIPYTVAEFVVGGLKQINVAGLYDGPFPWENEFGFRLAGMFGNDFLKQYTVTFDFTNMRIIFR